MGSSDERYVREAIAEALKAAEIGEVPIGCVIVKDDQIIARAHNLREILGDPTAHAEMLAIRRAAEVVGGWRLTGTTMYVTIEPCAMCAGAIVLARIDRLVYGAKDPKAGAVESVMRILDNPSLNHRVAVRGGVCEEECAEPLKEFFANLRRGAGAADQGGLENR